MLSRIQNDKNIAVLFFGIDQTFLDDIIFSIAIHQR